MSSVFNQPWLINEQMFDVIEAVIASELAGQTRPVPQRRASMEPRPVNNVDIIPVIGVISPRINLLDEISGGTSMEKVQEQFDAALANPDTVAVLFLFDSPGGNAKGVFEMADRIWHARQSQSKLILGHVEGQADSAAYLLASQCDELTATSGSTIGSIGAFAKFVSRDRQDKNAGIESVVIRSDPMKGIGADVLTNEQRAYLQQRINDMGRLFQSYVMRARPGAKLADAGAKQFMATVPDGAELPSAMDLGLLDRVATLGEVLYRFAFASRELVLDSRPFLG